MRTTDQDKHHSTDVHLTLQVAFWQQEGARWWGASMKPVPPQNAISRKAVSHLLRLGLPCPVTTHATATLRPDSHTYKWSGIMDFQFDMSSHRLVTGQIDYIASIKCGANSHLRQIACLHLLKTTQTSSGCRVAATWKSK